MDNRYNNLLAEKEKLEKKIEVLHNRITLKANSESIKKRKARTRALIQKGALLEKYFSIAHLSVSDTESFLAHFSGYIKNDMPEKFKQK